MSTSRKSTRKQPSVQAELISAEDVTKVEETVVVTEETVKVAEEVTKSADVQVDLDAVLARIAALENEIKDIRSQNQKVYHMMTVANPYFAQALKRENLISTQK